MLHTFFGHFFQFLLVKGLLIHDLLYVLLVAFGLLDLSPLRLPWVQVGNRRPLPLVIWHLHDLKGLLRDLYRWLSRIDL